ncbi:MAG: putative Se/S carrier-like protein [Butyricicoccus sp.]
MKKAMIVCRSQTEALKCVRMLEGAGVGGVLRKPPREKRDNSCAWGVRIRREDLAAAQRRMLERNFVPVRVYEFEDTAEGREGT